MFRSRVVRFIAAGPGQQPRATLLRRDLISGARYFSSKKPQHNQAKPLKDTAKPKSQSPQQTAPAQANPSGSQSSQNNQQQQQRLQNLKIERGMTALNSPLSKFAWLFQVGQVEEAITQFSAYFDGFRVKRIPAPIQSFHAFALYATDKVDDRRLLELLQSFFDKVNMRDEAARGAVITRFLLNVINVTTDPSRFPNLLAWHIPSTFPDYKVNAGLCACELYHSAFILNKPIPELVELWKQMLAISESSNWQMFEYLSKLICNRPQPVEGFFRLANALSLTGGGHNRKLVSQLSEELVSNLVFNYQVKDLRSEEFLPLFQLISQTLWVRRTAAGCLTFLAIQRGMDTVHRAVEDKFAEISQFDMRYLLQIADYDKDYKNYDLFLKKWSLPVTDPSYPIHLAYLIRPILREKGFEHVWKLLNEYLSKKETEEYAPHVVGVPIEVFIEKACEAGNLEFAIKAYNLLKRTQLIFDHRNVVIPILDLALSLDMIDLAKELVNAAMNEDAFYITGPFLLSLTKFWDKTGQAEMIDKAVMPYLTKSSYFRAPSVRRSMMNALFEFYTKAKDAAQVDNVWKALSLAKPTREDVAAYAQTLVKCDQADRALAYVQQYMQQQQAQAQ